MQNIEFYPAVGTTSELSDLIYRAAWHFDYLTDINFVIYVSNTDIGLDKLDAPLGFSDEIDSLVSEFTKKVELKSDSLISKESVANATAIIKWQEDDKELNAFLAKNSKCTIYRTDPKLVRHEGSFYIQCAFDLLKDKDEVIKNSQSKFKRIFNELGFFDQAWVLATGPCIDNYKKHDFSNALTVACNSTILDDELFEYCKPQIVVFADPIFHFGVSKYAGEFRKSVKHRLETSDISIVVPLKHYSLLLSVFPEYAERIIGVPFIADIDFNSDINSTFNVKTTANILTLLLLPVAATFSNSINILGCDGRSFDDDEYFWNHGKSVQINDKMKNIQEVHPGFFDIDYNEYYFEHCHMLECQLTRGEENGKKYVHHAQSFIPALRDRNEKFTVKSKFTNKHCILLEPDGIGMTGHYVTWHNQLTLSLRERKNDVTVFCNKKQKPELYLANALQTFTSHSWGISRADWCMKKNFADHASFKLFFEELQSALLKYSQENKINEITLFIYFGSVQILSGLHAIKSKLNKMGIEIKISLCLFHESVILDHTIKIPRLPPNARAILFEALAQKDSYKVTCQTDQLAKNLYERINTLTGMMPHPIPAGVQETRDDSPKLDTLGNYRVVFPCALRNEKGALFVKEFMQDIWSSNISASDFDFVVRKIEGLDDSDVANVTWVDAVETDQEYRELLNSADVIVIPYLSPQFTYRTSGIIVDAMQAKKPVIVFEGTWLADVVKKYHAGLVIKPYSSYSLLSAISVMRKNKGIFDRHAKLSFMNFKKHNNWENLVEVMFDR